MIEVQKVTNALLALLRTHLGDNVYDHDTVPDTPTTPYYVVYRIPGGTSGGPMADPEADLTLVFQINAVGKRRDQAEWASDKVTEVMLGRDELGRLEELPLPSTMFECGRMRSDVPGGVEQEGAPPNAVYTAVQRFEIAVTPQNS